MNTYYLAAFMPAEEGGYDIVIPDVPNAFTCADTLEEGFEMAADVLSVMLRDLVENNKAVPAPSPLEEVKIKTARHLEDIDHQPVGEVLYQLVPAPNLDMAPVKVTISLPKAVLADIDTKAKGYGYTRSGFLAAAAQSYRQDRQQGGG